MIPASRKDASSAIASMPSRNRKLSLMKVRTDALMSACCMELPCLRKNGCRGVGRTGRDAGGEMVLEQLRREDPDQRHVVPDADPARGTVALRGELLHRGRVEQARARERRGRQQRARVLGRAGSGEALALGRAVRLL